VGSDVVQGEFLHPRGATGSSLPSLMFFEQRPRRASRLTVVPELNPNSSILILPPNRYDVLQVMNPLAMLGYEFYGTRQQRVQHAPNTQTPVLVPAPEDPPSREAFMLDREHNMHRLEGIAIATLVLFVLIAGGTFLGVAVLVLLVWLARVYLVSRQRVDEWNLRERLRAQGRLIEPPQGQPRYTVQPLPALTDGY
jgi:hypothetical protein